ncbi:hypothetical protein ACLMJK_005628 [Lecanora helva]
MVYVSPCRCWKLQKIVHLNPDDPQSLNVKGSLDCLTGALTGETFTLKEQKLFMGEVNVSADGLVYPDGAFKQPEWGCSSDWEPTMFSPVDKGLDHYINGLYERPEYPPGYLAPEQHHLFVIPKDTPVPQGLYLRARSGSGYLAEGIAGFYRLRISEAMTLKS